MYLVKLHQLNRQNNHQTKKFFPTKILDLKHLTCSSCNEHHDRDLNASKNILKQGINILSGYGIESDIKQKQEEALPLGESVIPEAQPSLVVG